MREKKFFVFFFLLSLLSGLNTKSLGHKISKDVLKKLARVESMADFRRVFLKDTPHARGAGDENDYEESTACEPRSTIIEVGKENPGDFLYYPSCIFANRCGGCCQPTILKKCVSTSSEVLFKKVWRIPTDGSSLMEVKVPYTNHVSCGCGCIAKPSECVGRQVFDKENCRCECNVKEAEKQCPKVKQWSDIYCDCVCKIQDCPSGRKLNKKTCKCELIG